MIREHDRIVLTSDLPSDGLKAGDVGVVVHVYRDGEAFEVEFFTLDGKTAAADGGCTDLSVIRTKTRDLAKWNSPEELVNTLRARDENVSTLTAKVEPGYVVKVVVPAREIDVVFVPFSVCRAMWQEKLRRYSP